MLQQGERVGKWRLIEIVGRRFRRDLWRCQCECGNERTVDACHLRGRKSLSCGCSRRQPQKHGGSMGRLTGGAVEPEYQSWRAMRERCGNPNGTHWALYGGRGIRVCERWDDYALFRDDMGPKPTARHSIDRIDPDGNYEPANCRWATQKEQCRHFSRNRLLTFQGETRTMVEWSEKLGLPYSAVNTRINRGWAVEKALTRPVGRWAAQAEASNGLAHTKALPTAP